MTHTHQTIASDRRHAYATRILGVMEDLKQLEEELVEAGLNAEAASAATVKADLEWQCEELAVNTQVQCSA